MKKLLPVLLALALFSLGLSQKPFIKPFDIKITDLLNVPWVDVRESSSFAVAIAAIGASEKTLLIPDQQDVIDDITTPSNVTLAFRQGGTLNISSTKTVTINGNVEAGLYQIFEGAGSVAFGSGYVKEVYPQWWGAVGDGSTDDTVAFQAVNDATGGKLFVPRGTYIVSNLTSVSDIRIVGENKEVTIIKHKASATDHMIEADGNFEISDITIDGNKANQTGRYCTIYYNTGDYLTVENCIFTNTVNRAISIAAISKRAFIKYNLFHNMAEHGGTLGQDTAAVSSSASGACRIDLIGNEVIHGTPADVDSAPGGFILSGSANSVFIQNNYFENIGQRKAGNYIGPIHLYTDCDKTIVTNNQIKNYYYVAITMQNSDEVICSENIIDGVADASAGQAINFSYQRTFGSILKNWICKDNIIKLSGDNTGIIFLGNSGFISTTIKCSGNTIYDVDKGIQLTHVGDVQLLNNTIDTCGSIGIYFAPSEYNSGRITIVGGSIKDAGNSGISARLGKHSIRDSDYRWTASGSGTNEYYLEASGGGDPEINEPVHVYENASVITNGAVGSLNASEWDYDDNDSLGFSTVYVRIAGETDPDGEAADYLEAILNKVYIKIHDVFLDTNTNYHITVHDAEGLQIAGNKFVGNPANCIDYDDINDLQILGNEAENTGVVRGSVVNRIEDNNSWLKGSDTWDPASIANDAEEAKEVTVTGAALGDFVIASFSLDVTDLVLNAQVTVANTVTCILANNTGGAIDLASGTVYVKVIKR